MPNQSTYNKFREALFASSGEEKYLGTVDGSYLTFIRNGGEVFPKDMYPVRQFKISKINYSTIR